MARWHRVLNGVVVGVAWLFIAVLFSVAIARVLSWDTWEVFACLDASTLVLFLPAWPIAALALWRRRWGLAAASVVMVATQIVLVAPELSAAGPLPGGLHGATILRVLDANVYANNPSMAGYAREIGRDRPDLVTLEEGSPLDLDRLSARGALDRLRHRYWNGGFGPRSTVIASRYPLGATEVVSADGQPYLVRTVVDIPLHPLRLWVVHTTAPVAPGVKDWNDELDGLDRLLRTVHPQGTLVVGDFNATWGNRGFRAILSTGLVDGAAARGQALAMTWSQLMSPLPPLIRIDHVLTRSGLVTTTIRTEEGIGSDHRALFATIAIIKHGSRGRAPTH